MPAEQQLQDAECRCGDEQAEERRDRGQQHRAGGQAEDQRHRDGEDGNVERDAGLGHAGEVAQDSGRTADGDLEIVACGERRSDAVKAGPQRL